MIGRELRQALAAGRRIYGIGIEGYAQPLWPKFFSQFDLDFVFVENEHMPLNRETASWACQGYAAHRIAPLLRIPDTSPAHATQGLDLGAHGIIAPYVETVDQARGLVGATKYRPLKGAELQKALIEGRFPSEQTSSYLQMWNPDVVLILMIESPIGVKNLPEILAIGGIDGVLIGPHDFSISHGVPEQYDHPVFDQAAQQVVRVCKEHGVSVGIYSILSDLTLARRWAEWGCNIILHGSDARFIANGIRNELHQLKRLLEPKEMALPGQTTK